MVFHVVLFRPQAGLGEGERQALLEALRHAAVSIPSVRRFQVGRRLIHGAGYEALMVQDFQYAAVVEFDDAAGLEAYLRHPAHEALGSRFWALSEVALTYDYEMVAAERADLLSR